MQRFDGMTDEESQPLIDFFMKHSIRPEFVWSHAVGNRDANLLGQSLHTAFRGQRLSGRNPHHAPDNRLRRRPVLESVTSRTSVPF